MIPKAIPMEIRHIVFLLVVFILYVIFGGLIFMLLESPEEQIKRKELETILNEFSVHIKQLNHSRISEHYIRTMIHKLLVAQDNNLIDSFGNQSQYINWSFINSFFFAITVTTTIGYGHLTPSTFFGKIFCIVYALFGIPITGLLIGSLADRFSKLYTPKAVVRKNHYQRQLSARFLMFKKGIISLVPWFFVFLVVPAIIFTCIEEWSFLDGFYYCFVTLSTIGFGDFVAGSFEKDYIWMYKIVVVFWIIFGLAYLSMVLNFIMQSLRSRHISNVMHSIRHRMSTPNLVNRTRHHPTHFKRQQSSPGVIYAHNGKKIFPSDQTENVNNNFLNVDNSTINSAVLHPDTNPTNKRMEFFNFFKHWNDNREKSPTPQLKSSLRQAYDDNVSIRQTNSLPDLTGEFIESCPSICAQCSSDCGKVTVV
ncbi:hypothetical protein BLOT_004320 [Blomia tropicalis]|nr:hypothetical protein BLOT_004320 [Blomia tropicalis]